MNKNDFPIFTNHKNLIYFDNAASSHKPKAVLDSINDFYTTSYSNVHRGNYTLSENATDLYEQARSLTAGFINASSTEIIFTSGTTDSINKFAQSIALKLQDFTIITTAMEHHSNFIPWQQLALQKNLKFNLIPILTNYTLDLEKLYAAVPQNTPAVIALTHMSNVLGTINPIKEIVLRIKQINPQCIVVVDAAQSIPHMKIDVKDLGCDVLAFSGHKMFGPTGIGVLFIKESLLNVLEPTVYGGGMIKKVEQDQSTWDDIPHSFEAGTPNIEGAIGLGAAINYINNIGYEAICIHETELINHFLNVIKPIEGLKIYGPEQNTNRGPVFSFSIGGLHPHDISTMLNEYDIATRSGHHCTQILHRDFLKLPATTRASLSIYNEKSEIDNFKESLLKIKKKFKI